MATDLIRYVAGEIAADGPEGSSIDRLGDFINEYAAHQASTSATEQSVLDEDLRNYVIQTLGRLPNISPGRFVKAIRTTKTESKRKGKGKQDASSDEEGEPSSTPRSKINSASLEANADHVDVQERDKGKSLQDLLAVYGTEFRLVADKDSIDGVCGSVVLGMSVAVQQLFLYVIRARGRGTSFPQIGKRFDYTTSSIFFLVKQLCDANLAIKFRAKEGAAFVSWIVAKQYAHLCPHVNLETLMDGQDDMAGADDDDVRERGPDEDEETENTFANATLQEMSPEAVQDLIRRDHNSSMEPNASRGEDDDEDVNTRAEKEEGELEGTDGHDSSEMVTLHGLLAYPPVDVQKQEVLLRDRILVRMRLLKLLFACKNHATIRADLIVRIGIKEPDPTMRKAFNAILRQMEAEDLIRRCLLRRPLEHDRDHKDHCWMATEIGREHLVQLSTSLQQKEIKRLKSELSQEIEKSKSKILLEPSFNKQMLDLIDESRERGMTIEHLNRIMGGNKARKRDLDHMLTALKKPSNLYYDDFTIFSALEQEGRTRSQRFYTRQWRPAHLAPNEDRRIDARKLEAWVKLPFERDISTPISVKAKGKGKMKSSQTVTEGDDEDELDEIGSESSVEAPRRVRKKVKAKATESEEPKIKGRPRKHHTEKALKLAQQYKEKKEARMKEEEERRGVENFLGEASTPVRTRKRKSIPIPATAVAEMDKEPVSRQAQTVSSREDAAAQTDVSPDLLPPSSLAPATPSRLINPKTPTRKRSPPQSTPRSTHADMKRSRTLPANIKKRPSVNLTLQLKIDALRDFFKREQIFESTTFEHNYTKFLRKALGEQVNTQPYEMDRKLRLKLLHQFEREGVICCKKVPAPVVSKDKLRTVWHIKEISDDRLSKYCREVSTGNVRRDGSRRGIDGKWEKYVAKEPILLEQEDVDQVDEFLLRLGSGAEFQATNLNDFLGNEKIREVFLDHEKVRSQYTGRFAGQGAQVRYLYTTVMQLLNDGAAGSFKMADKTFDLTWWIKDARFDQYLKLVTPNKDDVVLKASQERRLTVLPVKKVAKDLQSALRILEGRQGLSEALHPLLDILVSFQIAEPVEVQKDGQVVACAIGRDNFTYRFLTTGRIPLEKLQFDEASASETFDLADSAKVESYWQLMMEIFTLQKHESIRRDMTPEQATLYKDLFTKTAWSPNYFMVKPQKLFLRKTMSLGAGPEVVNDDALLERISRICLSPKDFVRRWYERRYKTSLSITLRTSKTTSSRNEGSKKFAAIKGTRSQIAVPLMQEKPLSIRKLNAIKRREVKERKNRYEEFGKVVNASLVEMGFSANDCTMILARLSYVRRQYSKSNIILTTKRVRSIFKEVMRGFEGGDATWKDIENRRRRPMQPLPVDKPKPVKSQEKEGPRSRKSAFAWTRDRDELLRDAVVILRCRDRFRSKNPSNIRRNWAALDQIFPDIGSQSRFNRFDMLEKAVGEEAYLQQLELEWDKVWAENRGDELEDQYPADPINFNLMHHVEFLRSHIDKVKVAQDVDNATADPLPLDTALLLQYFDYDRPFLSYDVPASNLARSLLADPSTETRSKALRANAFTLGNSIDGNMLSVEHQRSLLDFEREKGLIMGTIKMILNTSEEDYVEAIATALCKDNASGEIIEEAIAEMMDLRIIRRKAKEDRELPNRNMVFTEEYERFHSDPLETIPFWELTNELDNLVRKGSTRLYQTSQDQETAAGLVLLGANRVDANIDFSPVERFKTDIFFNAKKLNDANLEVPVELQVRGRRKALQKKWARLIEETEAPREAVLKWVTEGLESIKERVSDAWTSRMGHLGEKEREAVEVFKGKLQEAGPNGLDNENLKEIELLDHSLLQRMLEDQPPLFFVVGYSERRVVSVEYINYWTVKLQSGRRIFPFKWYDIHGSHLDQIWSQCVKLVVHAIITRPGITVAQLMIQFKLALDRMELQRIINHACSMQVIYKILCSDHTVKGQQAEWHANSDDEIALMAYPITE